MAIRTIPQDSLRDVRNSVLAAALPRLLFGRYRTNPVTLYARNALRLIDYAIGQYRDAHADLRRFVRWTQFGGLDRFLSAQSHLDACVLGADRSRRYFLVVEGFALRAADGSLVVPAPPSPEVLREPAAGRLRKLRNAIAHYDERLLKGSTAPGRLTALNPDDRGISLDGEVVEWDELTRWLRQLHSVGRRFAL